jgi:hypothetical protein
MYLASVGTAKKELSTKSSWILTKGKLVGAGICLGIAWQLHYLALILAPVYAIIILIKRPRPIKDLVSNLALLAIGWVIGFLPFLAFEIYHNFPNTRTVVEFTTRPGGGVLKFEFIGFLRSIIRNIIRLFFTVLNWPHGMPVQLAALIVTVGGVLASIARRRWELVTWFVLSIGIFSLYQGSIADYYYGFLFPAPFLLAGATAQLIWKKSDAARPVILFALILYTLDQSSRWFLKNQPNHLLNQTENVANEVIAVSSAKLYNFALITNGNSDHAYRYFLERKGLSPTALEDQVTEQLIVVCEKPEPQCQPLGHPVWEIAGFGRAEVTTRRTVPPGLSIYHLTHYETSVDLIGKPAPK